MPGAPASDPAATIAAATTSALPVFLAISMMAMSGLPIKFSTFSSIGDIASRGIDLDQRRHATATAPAKLTAPPNEAGGPRAAVDALDQRSAGIAHEIKN